MSIAKAPKALLNLQKTTVLVADADIMGQNIVVQILSGFGARNIVRCEDIEELKRQVTVANFELIIIDPSSFGAEGYEVIGWEGVFAPLGTSREIVHRVNAMINEILMTPEMRELWASKGVDFIPNTAEQFAAKVREDYENVGRLIKAAGIKAE